jgi:hypothetical protein
MLTESSPFQTRVVVEQNEFLLFSFLPLLLNGLEGCHHFDVVGCSQSEIPGGTSWRR